MNLEALYSHLPIWLQNTICSVKGLQIQRDRFGDGFPEMLAGAEQRARWSDDRVGAFRDVRLLSNRPEWRASALPESDVDTTLRFSPHFGWKGHVKHVGRSVESRARME